MYVYVCMYMYVCIRKITCKLRKISAHVNKIKSN